MPGIRWSGVFIGALLFAVALYSPLHRDLSALLVLICWVVLTGGLHLDGFADSCDGLFASTDPEKRLTIMKDPRVGSWAVIGLILLLLGKWLTIRALDPELLVLAPVFGRWALVFAACRFPGARAEGSGAYFRQGLGSRQLMLASATVLIVVIHYAAVLLWLMTLVLALAVGHWASKRLGGGITGDVYGAICELTEFACLLAIGVIYG